MRRPTWLGKVSARARRGGGREVPLPDPVPSGQTTIQADSTGNAPPQPLEQVSDFFGPLQPPTPQAPQDVAGRRFDFPTGYNLSQRPRAYEPVSFSDLRALADGYDLMRVAIETRKDQLCTLPWSIGPRDPKEDVEKNPALRKRIEDLERMLHRPDGRMFWSRWIRAVVEDLLVLDAPAVYVRRTLGGDPLSLHHMDGATIKLVLDEQGNTPEPPFAAYQQILKGLPARNYSLQDLVYLPRNVRTNRVYGFSPVEQVIMTVNIALRRQMWQLAYFTDGNVPDSLIGVPSSWTPDQIRQFQDWFDSILSGNTERRRGATFVPGEVAKSYVPTKEAEIFGAAEEWIGRVICWAFGLSHQALVKEVNRATADTAREMELQEGLGPYMVWVKELVDTLLLDFLGEEDLEFKWTEDKEVDAQIQETVLTGYVKEGVISRNEARATLGRDPDESPEADMLMIDTPNGPVPLNTDDQIELKQKNVDAFTGMGLGPDGHPVPPPQESGDESSGEAAPGGKSGGGADSSPATPPPSSGKKPGAKKAAEGEVAMASRPFRPARSRVRAYP